jgi:hypothetical protein
VVRDTLRIEVSTPTVVAGYWRDLYLTEWRTRATTAELVTNYDLQRAHIRRLSAKLVTFSVVPAAAIKPIDAEMRKVIDDTVVSIHPHTKAAALVLPATGFGGAIIRSILTGLNLLRRLDFPNKITSTVPAALTFVAPHVDGAPTAAELEAVYDELLAAPHRGSP